MKRFFVVLVSGLVLFAIWFTISAVLKPDDIVIDLNDDGTMTFAETTSDIRVFDHPEFTFFSNKKIIITDSKGAYFECKLNYSDEDYKLLQDTLRTWREGYTKNLP